jgi:urease accessory protein
MAWHGTLDIDYRLAAAAHDGVQKTVGRALHSGPLRILRSLYPESPRVCHQVLVHPPGGIAGGDRLALALRLAEGSHALLTTPGATRFYRSAGEDAEQTLDARVADGARLEWLPLETLLHDGARARNRLRFRLAPGAEMIGWDALALGLPASQLAFERGRFEQRIELADADAAPWWIERGLIDFGAAQAAATRRRLASPLGWAGCGVLMTLWFASGQALADARREQLVDAARTALAADATPRWGCTAPNPQVVVVRGLGSRVEPLMRVALRIWAAWRQAAWQQQACAPRVWRT